MKHPTNDSVRESKRAEEALRASEDRFRKVFEYASIGILIADPNRNYLAVNDRFCEITGYSRETLLTLGCGQIVHPDDQEMDVAEIGRLIRGESKSFLRDLRYVHANGSIVWVRVHVSVFHSDSQEGIQIIAVVEDITDRKRAEESLRRFELIAEHSRDIVLFMRCDNGRLIEVNAAAENAYGYSREELLALSIHDLRAAETQALTVSQMAEADVHGILFETIHCRKDGSTFPVEVSSQGATVDGVRMLISVVRDITERKEMKDALQESEESLNAIFNAAAQAIFLMNTSGIILAMNAFLSERIGHKPSEMLGRCIYDFLPADVAASRRARVQEVIRTGRMIRIEDQSEGRWFDSTIYPIIDSEGRVTRLAVFANDITEHKKAKEALRESEERFRSAFDKGAIPMTLAALDSRLLFVNAAFSKMLGYSEAELAEMSFFKITHPDDIAANQAGLAPVIRGEKDSFRMEKRYIRKNSRIVWADMSTSSVRDASGKPLYYVTYVQDITERKLAEDALRESERRYRMLVDSAPDAMIVYREGRILSANALALKLYGAETIEQLQSKTVLDLVHPKYRETVSERMKRVEAGESVELKETAVVRFDGQVVPIESVASMMINYEGEPAVQVTIRDITERKRAEEVVRASTKKTETVLASITDMYVSYDNEWRFVDLNPVAEKLIGRTRQELIGKVLWEVFPQLRESEIHEHYLKAVRDKCTSSFEAYSPATGHWHEFYLYPAEDGLSVYLRDISDRKQMEQALQRARDELELKVQDRTRQLSETNKALLAEIDTRRRIAEELQKSEEAYRLLVELNPVGVYTLIVDPLTLETKRLHCNEAHLRILGYASLQEWLAESTSVVFHSETDFKNFREHLRKDGKVVNYKVRMRRKDGKAIWVLLNATARDHGGKILIESIMTDITSQKRIEERLRSAQNKLRAMASEIVLTDERSRQHLATELHDTVLQTLGAAKMRSELLNQYIPEEGAAHYSELQNMLLKSIAQSRLIMSEMSPPVLYELGFVPALEWLAEQMESQHDLAVNFETTEKGPQQLAHEVQLLLFQATRELLMNVAKHAKADSAVVKLSGNANLVKIEVIDKGAGFDTKQAFRTDISGGGFGLFSIRERLRHFGGELKIRSKPGEGTRVVITAPRIIEK